MFNPRFTFAFSEIKKAKRILLVTHDRPDGDALSSVCAFIEILEQNKKKYRAFCYDPPPPQFNFLPHIEKIIPGKETLDFDNYDLTIVLDCGSLSRTNLVKEITNKKEYQKIIEIDHHQKVDDYANIEIKTPHVSSTAELIYYFLRSNNIKINKNLANCILTGILTDTGNLLYTSTTDKTIKIASEMLLYGARYPIILENTWQNKSLPAMKTWGQALSSLEINKKYNFAYSVLTNEEIENSGAIDEEFEGIAGFLSNLYGVKGVVFLREEKKGVIKGSLRTEYPNVDVSKLANHLGGGGHKKASGFKIEGTLEKTDSGWKII